jgi:S-DNA-T family DNA segregation ATPase FtsK/SpoIIIE
MPFNRPPRLQTPLPDTIIKRPESPLIPSKPDKGNWLTMLLPVGAVLLSVVLMFVLMSNNSGSMLNYLLFIPIMLVSYLAAIITNSTQKKNYLKKVEEGRVIFNDLLNKFENQLAEAKRNETQLRLTQDPDTLECIRRAQKVDPRLGERRPTDSDFLHLRLGVGTVPANYHIEDAPREKVEEFSEEFDHLEKIVAHYNKLVDVPIQARIPLTGSIGISGIRNETLGVTRALLSHLLVHHWASEVKLLVISRPSSLNEWDWITKTPHISALAKESSRNPDSKSDKPDGKLMAALEVELQRREQQVEARKLMQKDDVQIHNAELLPRLIIVFDYLPVNYIHPALNLLYKKGPDLGVYGIFLTVTAKEIPGNCGAVIQCENGRFFYNESGPVGYKCNGSSDRLGLQQVEELASALSNIEWPTSEDTSQPPETITFLQLFGV